MTYLKDIRLLTQVIFFNAVTRAIYRCLELKNVAVKLLIIVVPVLQGKEKTEVYFFPTILSTKPTPTLQFNSSLDFVLQRHTQTRVHQVISHLPQFLSGFYPVAPCQLLE